MIRGLNLLTSRDATPGLHGGTQPGTGPCRACSHPHREADARWGAGGELGPGGALRAQPERRALTVSVLCAPGSVLYRTYLCGELGRSKWLNQVYACKLLLPPSQAQWHGRRKTPRAAVPTLCTVKPCHLPRASRGPRSLTGKLLTENSPTSSEDHCPALPENTVVCVPQTSSWRTWDSLLKDKGII